MNDTITMPRSVVEQALHAIKYSSACVSKQLTTQTKHDYALGLLAEAIEALRAALEQPPAVKDSLTAEQPQSVTDCHQSQPQGEQEPVAWQYRMRPDWGSKKDCWGPWQDCTKEQAAMYQRVPLLHDWAYESRQLYTRPQPRQPLTDEEVQQIWRKWVGTDRPNYSFARAIERAHGIGGEA